MASRICCKQELDEKENEIEFYKDQERVYQEEIQAYKKVEASKTRHVVVIADSMHKKTITVVRCVV